MSTKVKKPLYKRVWVWVLGVVVVGVVAASGGNKAPQQPASQPVQSPPAKQTEPAKAPANDPGISKAEFDKIQNGMTYDQVTAIVGGPGEVISESGSKGDQYHTIAYSYKGESGLGANAMLMFQSEKLQNKSQANLK